MKALVNLDADFTMFILISPPPVLKVCVMVWYCGMISFNDCPSNKCFVMLLSTVLSSVITSALMITLLISQLTDVLPD